MRCSIIDEMCHELKEEYIKNKVKNNDIEYYYNRDKYTVSVYNDSIIEKIANAFKNYTGESISQNIENSFFNMPIGAERVISVENGFMNRLCCNWIKDKRTYTMCTTVSLKKTNNGIVLSFVILAPDMPQEHYPIFLKDIVNYTFSSEVINEILSIEKDVDEIKIWEMKLNDISHHPRINVGKYEISLSNQSGINNLKALSENCNYDGNKFLEGLVMSCLMQEKEVNNYFKIMSREDNLEILRKHIIINLIHGLKYAIEINTDSKDCDLKHGFRILDEDIEKKVLSETLKESIYYNIRYKVFDNYLEEFEILKDFNGICEILVDKNYNFGERILNLYKALGGKKYTN